MDAERWAPSSWRTKPVAQSVEYPNEEHLASIRSRLATLPPLVTSGEIERLRSQLASVQLGQAFLLHAGDCAESFAACTHENISNKIGLILSFSLILIWGGRIPVVRIGRIAGQFAKPRSSKTEKLADGREVLSFREEFERITEGLADALDFSRTIGAGDGIPFEMGGPKGVHGEVDFYTSHEGLMLDYEEALTRLFALPPALQPTGTVDTSLAQATPAPQEGQSAPQFGSRSSSRPVELQNYKNTNQIQEKQELTGFYNTSAHFLWVGDRTRQLDGAHIEYFRGIRNPIGVKVGPSMGADELLKLVKVLNPDREPGRLTLITRYGAGKVEEYLPGHIAAVQQSGVPVIWAD
ncbi:hypothetical protein FRC17_007944 [Serendipita sp. 399]|nr:hypothetical protein FRC17_007944 [Serendipita sp. 399]